MTGHLQKDALSSFSREISPKPLPVSNHDFTAIGKSPY